PFIYERFANSPHGTLTERWELNIIGWRVFTMYPIFGVGPGHWIPYFHLHDYLWVTVDPLGRTQDLPIHNVILWLAVEIGLFGLVPYLGIIATAMLRLLRLVRRRRDIPGRLAIAALIGLTTTLFNGLTDPTFRESNVFLMFWILISLSVALPRLRPGAGAVLMAPPRPAFGLASARGTAAGGA